MNSSQFFGDGKTEPVAFFVARTVTAYKPFHEFLRRNIKGFFGNTFDLKNTETIRFEHSDIDPCSRGRVFSSVRKQVFEYSVCFLAVGKHNRGFFRLIKANIEVVLFSKNESCYAILPQYILSASIRPISLYLTNIPLLLKISRVQLKPIETGTLVKVLKPVLIKKKQASYLTLNFVEWLACFRTNRN